MATTVACIQLRLCFRFHMSLVAIYLKRFMYAGSPCIEHVKKISHVYSSLVCCSPLARRVFSSSRGGKLCVTLHPKLLLAETPLCLLLPTSRGRQRPWPCCRPCMLSAAVLLATKTCPASSCPAGQLQNAARKLATIAGQLLLMGQSSCKKKSTWKLLQKTGHHCGCFLNQDVACLRVQGRRRKARRR